ncbi:MAG: M23 family metallopeptidase [Candidatus Odinarchaeota archaeon]
MGDLQIQLLPESIISTWESERFPIFFTPVYGCLITNKSTSIITIDKIRFKLSDESESYTELELTAQFLENMSKNISKHPQFQELLDLIYREIEKDQISGLFSLKLAENKSFSLVHTWLQSQFVPNSLLIQIFYQKANNQYIEEYKADVGSYTQKNRYHFPISGSSFILDGGDLRSSNHKMFDFQSNGLDIVKIFEDGKAYNNSYFDVKNHKCFGESVLSACDGTVIKVTDGFSDEFNVEGLINGNFFLTLMKHRENRLSQLNEQGSSLDYSLLGNSVVIQHSNAEFSIYAHLKKNSIIVAEGQEVKTGQKLAEIGNSGSSIIPHLHFQVMNNESIYKSLALPVVFSDITGQLLPIKRPLWTGDVIVKIES